MAETITKCTILYREEITHIYPLGRGYGAGTDILILKKFGTDMIQIKNIYSTGNVQ